MESKEQATKVPNNREVALVNVKAQVGRAKSFLEICQC
jgi:hypothetical protein